jgi:RNA polymerase sigma-70 factor (ECF subfamily)
MSDVTRLLPGSAPCAGSGRVPPAPDGLSRQLESVVQRFVIMVRAVGRRNGLDDAEVDDLIQAVRVRLWQALGTGETIPVITSSYVYRTALTAAIDIVRARRGRRHTAEDPSRLLQQLPSSDRPDHGLEESEAAGRILTVVEQLPPDRRVAVKLYLAGYGREEIAGMLEWSGPRTRNLIYRGLEQVRQRLTRLGLGPAAGGHGRRVPAATAVRTGPRSCAGVAERLPAC